MATSSKDIEILWQRYSEEGSKKGISVRDFFEKNGVPYHIFEKWYKRKYQQPEIVDCNVTGSPDLEEDQSGKEPGNGDSPKPKAISYISITLSNGVKVEHRRLSYPELLTFIRLNFIDSKPIYELEWKYVVALLSFPAITKLDSICEN